MSKVICVAKLSTTSWHDERGLHIKRSLRYLMRDSEEFFKDYLTDPSHTVSMEGLGYLQDKPDGVYKVVATGETGYRLEGV